MIAHTIKSAAATMHMSPTFFRAEVLPYIKVVRRGGRVIIAESELQRWLDVGAEVT